MNVLQMQKLLHKVSYHKKFYCSTNATMRGVRKNFGNIKGSRIKSRFDTILITRTLSAEILKL